MMIPKWSTTATLAVLLALGNAVVVVQSTRPEWKLVPTMPPSCFADDGFGGKVGEAQNAVLAAKDAQDVMNSKIREKFDNMDMMEKAQRMQAWMMRNPQAASKMIEASSDADGAAAFAEEQKVVTERLDKELESHKRAFDTAVERAVQPVKAKIDVLLKTRTRPTHVDVVFLTAADYAAYETLLNERNAAYEKACAPFFGANGSMHKWLQAFRTEVTEKALSAEERGNAIMAQQFAIMETPSGGYRTTSGYDLVRLYLSRLSEVVGYRGYKVKPDPVLKPNSTSR